MEKSYPEVRERVHVMTMTEFKAEMLLRGISPHTPIRNNLVKYSYEGYLITLNDIGYYAGKPDKIIHWFAKLGSILPFIEEEIYGSTSIKENTK